jgi:hypothetical protein
VSRLQDYDPTVIEVAARRLYEKATASLLVSIVAGASLGAAFGAVPLTPLGASWPIPSTFGPATMLLGALAGAAVGYVIGDNRAFRHRLQAQAMLTDLQRELNTAATVQALREIVAQLAEQFDRSPARSVTQIPASVPAPAPVLPQSEPAQAPPAVLLTVPPASPEPPTPVFSLPEPALSPQPPAPEPVAFAPLEETPATLAPEAFSAPAPDPEPDVFTLPEPVAFPPLEETPATPEAEAFPAPALEPELSPSVFALPEPVAFPLLEETPATGEADEPPARSHEFLPPLSADSL